MTDHLPECPMLDEQYTKHPLEQCDYCDMLRACKKRVLIAAREAVAALPVWQAHGLLTGDLRPARIDREEVLAAIDALKEKP